VARPEAGDDDDDDDDDDIDVTDADLRGAIDAAPDAPDAMSDPDDPDGAPGRPDGAPMPTDGAPGSACTCDAECDAVEGHAGICVVGICMTRASADCTAAGSSGECGAGSRCWGLEGEDGAICWPDCDAYECDGVCDADGSCAPTDTTSCDAACGSYCPCDGAEDCEAGENCVAGDCVVSSGEGPGPGPGPACPDLPPRDCTGGTCDDLGQFDPHVTAHYDDYPINGETAANQYRSWARRDLRMLLDYATAKVLCKAADWDTGIGGPLGFGDMSEMDGAIPGTSIGEPGHPAGTHVNGRDIDLAYYQLGTADNRLRPICTHITGGADQYHCTADPHLLDVWRSALFLGAVFESSRVRVVGVDGRAGPILEEAIAELCATGWITEAACENVALAYETTDMGFGWFYFHHHHMHISLNATGVAEEVVGAMPCKAPGCDGKPVKPNPKRRFGRSRK
jgi:hypothetical protein